MPTLVVRAVPLLLAALLLAGASAAGEEPDAPRLPEPAVGDQASYWLVQVTVDEEGEPVSTTTPRLLDAFRVVEARTVPTDEHGWVRGLTVQEKQGQGPHPDQPRIDEHVFHPATGSIVASASHGVASWPHSDDTAWTRTADATATSRVSGWSFCGLINALQGQSTLLDEPVEPFDTCSMMTEAWEVPTYEREAFDHVDTLPSDHGPVHVLEATHHDHAVQAWFAEEIAYPVRFVYPLITGPAGDTDVHPRTYNVVTLHGYEPGQTEPDTALLTQQASHEKSALDQRQPWLLPEGDLEHPFPLSEAYQLALEDEGGELEAFLAEHPEAYPRSINPTVTASASELEHRWGMQLTDANASAHLSVTQTIHKPTDDEDGGPYLPNPWELTEDEEEHRVERDVDFHWAGPVEHPLPPPASLPDELPTVDALVDAWAIAHQREANLSRITWELSVGSDRLRGCQEPSCVEPAIDLRIREDGEERSRSASFGPNGTLLETRERWTVAEEAERPGWLAFAEDVRELDRAEDAPEPVLEGFQGLPPPPEEGPLSQGSMWALAGLATAGGFGGVRLLRGEP